MNYSNIPKPIGCEIIKMLDGTIHTLDDVLEIKSNLLKLLEISYENRLNIHISDVINENNIFYSLINYESLRYTDLIQPINILDFYYYIKNIYNSFICEYDNNVLNLNEFKKLNKINYKNINIFYKNSNIQPSNKCPICIDTFKPNCINIILDCKHNFHKNCIKKWLVNESATCPICKKNIF